MPAADLTLRDWRICREVITGGDIAFAEAYMDGRWHTGDLTTLLTVIAFNQRALNARSTEAGGDSLHFV